MPDGPSTGTNLWTTCILIVVLIIFGAIFSASETALASCNRIRLKVRADDGHRPSKIVCKVIEKFDHAVSAILIGNNIVAVFVSSIATLLFIQLFQDKFSNTLIATLSTIASTAVCFLFSDTLPKSIARLYPDKIACLTGWFIYGLMFLVWPFAKIFDGLNFLVQKIFHIKEEPKLTEEDFTNIIESIEEEGLIKEQESDIIQNSLDFNETIVRDVLTPVDQMFAVDIEQITHESLNKIILDTPYSRIPVYKKDINHIIGVLVVNSYLKSYFTNKKVSIKSTLKKPFFVSPSVSLDDLLEGFNKKKTHIAIVVKDQQTIGMVTMEDLLDELVGDTTQEPDNDAERGEK